MTSPHLPVIVKRFALVVALVSSQLLSVAPVHARAAGAMVAIELAKDGDAHRPDAELTAAIVKLAAQRGLILLSCGTYANVIRILVPLTVPDAVLDEGLAIIAECFAQLA